MLNVIFYVAVLVFPGDLRPYPLFICGCNIHPFQGLGKGKLQEEGSEPTFPSLYTLPNASHVPPNSLCIIRAIFCPLSRGDFQHCSPNFCLRNRAIDRIFI